VLPELTESPNEPTGEVRTYADLLIRALEERPNAEALVFPDARFTYRELHARASARARELWAIGVRPGDKFGVLLPNCPASVELLLAGGMIGATVVPINTRFKVRELRHVVTDADMVAVWTTDELDEHVNFKELLYEAVPGLRTATDPFALELAAAPRLRTVALVGERPAEGMPSSQQVAECVAALPGDFELRPPEPDDTWVIMYTSGTTATPKGCMLSHRAIVLDALGVAERFRIPPSDRWWDPLPLFHSAGIMLMSACFSRGATFVSMPRFEPEAAFDLIERERITVHYPLFPTITLSLMHHPRFGELDLSDARVVVSVAPPDVQRQIQEAYAPAVLISAYGITELCGTLIFNSLDDTADQRLTTCGTAIPGFEMRVVDPETGARVPDGERGELIGRGPSRFDGYYNNPEQTKLAIDDEGFFHTGDLCSVDADGRVSYHGRIKDMLKVGGENVAAIEVESFLATHPAIKMAQVVGVPDSRLVEVPAAFVELAPGATLTEEDVIVFCTGQIAGFKVPRYVRFVDEWPMSATKVQKFRLRDQLVAELEL
jgi:fatty-acyl-CoA synthase